ncbi:cytidine deaminase [Erythrobacter dokdonensis]|jgi:cytidine deaminase|uniref:cytidine deaminase n=1 Tax=Erythrobacter dokdonensis TaxID=328225 RepID=UPI001E4798F8|nr:cytidine deaminase [Erythrobacter dokdonensis]MEE4315891.1 cytidine deaminase [Erythrobacter sp.]
MGGGAEMSLVAEHESALVAAAYAAAEKAYAPYSNYPVGAALLFDDGAVITGCNVENASYGLALCAETVAVAKAFEAGRRGGLVAVAVVGLKAGDEPITPCGRCRQVLNEVAALGGTDPLVLCVGQEQVRQVPLSTLLPHAFGPSNLEG